MQVAVVAGAVGCYYGGQLLRAGHEVTFIGRQPHVDYGGSLSSAISAHSRITSFWSVIVKATTNREI